MHCATHTAAVLCRSAVLQCCGPVSGAAVGLFNSKERLNPLYIDKKDKDRTILLNHYISCSYMFLYKIVFLITNWGLSCD